MPPIALIYHDIVAPEASEEAGFPGELSARYKVAPADFESHLDAIGETGLVVGTVDPGRPWPDVAITFDDGGASAPDAAARLERRGWRGHFFITTGLLGTPGFMTVNQVWELAAGGHAIGSHTHSHPAYFRTLSRAEMYREWQESGRVLAEILGKPPEVAAVPGGSLSDDVVAAATEAGYTLVMTSEPTTRIRVRGATTMLGRYAVWGSTPPSQVAGYVRGSRLTRSRLWLEWNAKKAAKRVSPAVYQRLRHLRARLDDGEDSGKP